MTEISISPAYLIAFEPREPHVDEDDLWPRGLPLIKLKSMVQGGRDVLLEAEVFGGRWEGAARSVVLGKRQQNLQHQRYRIKFHIQGQGFQKVPPPPFLKKWASGHVYITKEVIIWCLRQFLPRKPWFLVGGGGLKNLKTKP